MNRWFSFLSFPPANRVHGWPPKSCFPASLYYHTTTFSKVQKLSILKGSSSNSRADMQSPQNYSRFRISWVEASYNYHHPAKRTLSFSYTNSFLTNNCHGSFSIWALGCLSTNPECLSFSHNISEPSRRLVVQIEAPINAGSIGVHEILM